MKYSHSKAMAVFYKIVKGVLMIIHICPPEPTTVIDLSGDSVEIIRQGAGDTSLISV
jgi:tRNA A37 threonylcarbamoyladenosine synthetase subunit TsaC/SUA5/YrdC